MNLLLLGATGLVGRNVLAQALASPAITRVIAPTRRPLEPHSKLTNPVSDRLEALLSEGINQGIDGVVCCLGTTIKKAGSKEAFREVDYALPLKFARDAHQHGVETFVLVSASTASVNSAMFYSRIKGEVERDIGLVGFRSLTIARPSLIGGQRDERRLMEHIALRSLQVLAPIVPKKLQINPAETIAAACLNAVMASDPGFHIRNAESLVAG
jgi:uncharacterized protein YbjT (DUF2867 family)